MSRVKAFQKFYNSHINSLFEVRRVGKLEENLFGSILHAQVDRHGDINSTKVGDCFLFGSGGANARAN